MRNTIIPIAIASILMAGISTASATMVEPGLISDFEDGSDHGWIAGRASEDEGLLPRVKDEGGNKYLEVSAYGETYASRGRGANRRIAFFNDSTWVGDYSNIDTISAKVKATSNTESALYLRLNFIGNDGSFYSSKNAFELATNGQWQDFTSALKWEDFFVQTNSRYAWDGSGYVASEEQQFADAITHIDEFKFVSNKAYPQWNDVDAVEAVLAVDDITAGVSAVPVPGAAWLMVSGLLGLAGMSSRKDKKA